MENYAFDEDSDLNEEQTSEQGALDSTEEGFLQGYSEEDEVQECAECGTAVRPEKKVVRQFENETYTFCSNECAKEFEEGLGE